MPIPLLAGLGGLLGGGGAAAAGGGLAGMLGGGLAGNLATAGLIGGSILGMSQDPGVRRAGALGQTLSLAPFLFGVGGPQTNSLSTTTADPTSETLQQIQPTGGPPAFQLFGGMRGPTPFG